MGHLSIATLKNRRICIYIYMCMYYVYVYIYIHIYIHIYINIYIYVLYIATGRSIWLLQHALLPHVPYDLLVLARSGITVSQQTDGCGIMQL